MRSLGLVSALLSASFAFTTSAADAPAAGKPVFDRWCAGCHAPGHGHPGTQQLGLTRGAKLAVLEQRSDLSLEYIRYVVRNGLNAMPPYRPSELPDAALEQISTYLAPPRKNRR